MADQPQANDPNASVLLLHHRIQALEAARQADRMKTELQLMKASFSAALESERRERKQLALRSEMDRKLLEEKLKAEMERKQFQAALELKDARALMAAELKEVKQQLELKELKAETKAEKGAMLQQIHDLQRDIAQMKAELRALARAVFFVFKRKSTR